MRAVLLSLLAFGLAAQARTPAERLQDQRLEAVHSQIVEWKKIRRVLPAQGVYQDFRAVFLPAPAAPETLAPAANNAEVRVIFGASTQATRDGVLYLAAPGDEFHGTDIAGTAAEEDVRRLAAKFKQRPDEAFGADEHTPIAPASGTVLLGKTHLPPAQATKSPIEAYTVAFRHATTHILATDLTEPAIRASLSAGHAYASHDWLGDPTGTAFFAQSYFGLFEMGDTVAYNPATGGIAMAVRLPVSATIRLLRDNAVVAEAHDWKLDYMVRDQGAYRLEAWLAIDGEERPWISTNPIFVRTPVSLNRPAVPPSEDVEVRSGISYTEGDPADADKHKLDLYLPKDKKDFPVLIFAHGGSWRTGDRSLYRALGDRFARAGIGVAIPSYRLMPPNPHPAQIEDLAAAFAWAARNVSQYGGDASRIYLSGHSAGAHLAALLALDDKYLRKFDLSPAAIRGVIAISGIYDVASLDAFVAPNEKDDKRDASPLAHTHIGAPPFWISYCQWDYLGLPKQARDFAAALRKNFVSARLLYVPGENHISEAISLAQEHGLLVDAILSVVK